MSSYPGSRSSATKYVEIFVRDHFFDCYMLQSRFRNLVSSECELCSRSRWSVSPYFASHEVPFSLGVSVTRSRLAGRSLLFGSRGGRSRVRDQFVVVSVWQTVIVLGYEDPLLMGFS